MRRFAPIGLALAGIGLVISIGALLLKGFIYAGYYLPQNPQLINHIGLAAAGLVLLGVSLFAILDPERTRALITGRQARHGSNSLIMLLALTGILIFINVIAYQNQESWDVSSTKQNTLASETLDTLAALSEPVRAVAFYTARTSTDQAKELLEKYRGAANGNFEYSFIDPEANPALAQEAEITADGTIALYLGQQKQLVTFASEQELTGALVRLMNPEERVVYFLGGHGELQAETSSETAYTTARQVLERKNYVVRALNLVSEESVPEDADVVVIAGPQTSLSTDEITKLKNYLASGGALVAMEEPVPLTKMDDKPDLLAQMLKTDWGVTLVDDMVIDPNVSPPLGGATLPTVAHPITQSILNVNVLYPTARSLILEPAGSVSLTDLGSTGQNSWSDANYSVDNAQLTYDEGADTPGPLQIGVAGEDTASGARVVVFGDAEFANDTGFYNYANGEMFINSVDWAAGQDKLISLTPYSSAQATFEPPSPLGTISLIVLAICVVPLLIVIAGGVVWVAHRRRG